MRFAIVETYNNARPFLHDVISAHVRDCKELLKEFPEIDLILTRADFKKFWFIPFDKIFIFYGSNYTDFQPIVDFLSNQPKAKLYWVTNEWNLTPNSSIRRALKQRGYSLITNFVESGTLMKEYKRYFCLNLNTLLFKEKSRRNLSLLKDRQYDFVYFGGYRVGRKKHFQQYFDGKWISVSTSKSNITKFLQLNCSARFIPPLMWGKNLLAKFKCSLYIEDEYTHEHYNYPANRFYECLNYGVLQFFEVSTIGTFEKWGLSLPNKFLVSSSREAIEKSSQDVESLQEWANEQQEWRPYCTAERREMLAEFKNILYEKVSDALP